MGRPDVQPGWIDPLPYLVGPFLSDNQYTGQFLCIIFKRSSCVFVLKSDLVSFGRSSGHSLLGDGRAPSLTRQSQHSLRRGVKDNGWLNDA